MYGLVVTFQNNRQGGVAAYGGFCLRSALAGRAAGEVHTEGTDMENGNGASRGSFLKMGGAMGGPAVKHAELVNGGRLVFTAS